MNGYEEYLTEFENQMKKVEEFDYNESYSKIAAEFTMYGKERYDYLKSEKAELFEEMKNSGTLGKHLADTMKECDDMEENLSDELAKEWFGCTMNTINVSDFSESVRRRRKIDMAVREIIRNELIYV